MTCDAMERCANSAVTPKNLVSVACSAMSLPSVIAGVLGRVSRFRLFTLAPGQWFYGLSVKSATVVGNARSFQQGLAPIQDPWLPSDVIG